MSEEQLTRLLERLGIVKTSKETHYFLTKDGEKWTERFTKPDRAYYMDFNEKKPARVFDKMAGVRLSSGANIGGRVLCWAPIDNHEILVRVYHRHLNIGHQPFLLMPSFRISFCTCHSLLSFRSSISTIARPETRLRFIATEIKQSRALLLDLPAEAWQIHK